VSGPAGVLGRQAARHVLVGLDLEVGLDLTGVVLVAARALQEAGPSTDGKREATAGSSGRYSVAGLSSLAMARVSCSQRVVSAASARRPSGVSR
jgi:hypothetical protein